MVDVSYSNFQKGNTGLSSKELEYYRGRQVLGGEWKKPGHSNGVPGFIKNFLGVLQYLVLSGHHIGEAHVIIVCFYVLVEKLGPDTEGLDVPADPALHQISATEAMG